MRDKVKKKKKKTENQNLAAAGFHITKRALKLINKP